MDSVRKAKNRLWSYPKWMASCTVEAKVYAQCVAQHMGEVQKDQCLEEFNKFRTCVQAAAKKAGSKM